MHGGPNFSASVLLQEAQLRPLTRSLDPGLDGGDAVTIAGLFRSDAPARDKAKTIIRKLAERLFATHDWPDALPGNPALVAGTHAIDENPWIPSGYTYLLQLIAHDMVDTIAIADGTDLKLQNGRLRPLLLDTLYGLGPMASAAPYQLDDAQKGSAGLVPRGRLRMGRIQQDGHVDGCPFRDIGRATTTATTDTAHPMITDKRWTEALIADPRNDDHALISQMTALWHVVHNLVIADIEQQCSTEEIENPEHSYRRFLMARHAVTAIYHAIIETDVLVRILHPDVYRRYARDNAPLLGAAGDAVPRIFSHGAFRFGHAMTRDNYVVNDKAPAGQEMARAFSLSSRHSPTRLPMTPEWVVDWDLFFEGGTQRPNLTHRIGPHYPRVFDHTGLFFISPEGGKGLAERDLVSAALAELPKVSTLYGDLMTRAGLAAASPSFADVVAPMDAWLMSKVPDAGERAIIAADPPLAFFVLFEAGLAPSNGRHLGPFGSIIIAEALFRPLRAFKSKLGGAATLKQRIAAGNGLLPGKPDALKLLTGAAVPEIDTMPKLIAFVKSHDGFPPVVQSNHG